MRCCLRRIYRELPIDAEIELRVRQLQGIHLTSSYTSQLIHAWRGDLFCELISTVCGGPAYVTACLDRDASEAPLTQIGTVAPHGAPTYLRWAVQLATLRSMSFYQEANCIEEVIRGLYGPREYVMQQPYAHPALAELLALPAHFERIDPTLDALEKKL